MVFIMITWLKKLPLVFSAAAENYPRRTTFITATELYFDKLRSYIIVLWADTRYAVHIVQIGQGKEYFNHHLTGPTPL